MTTVPPHDLLVDAVLATSLPSPAALLVAVSGGSDSVALLDTVFRVNRTHERGWRLHIAHVNHQTRGRESDEDEDFVRVLASERDLPLHVRRVDVAAHVQETRVSWETAARELRHLALRDITESLHLDRLLLGHTLDDQAETLLMHLLRGSGLVGIAGMRQRVGAVVRPFLTVSRVDIVHTLERTHVAYRTDSSNVDRRYSRNRVRLDVLPVLERENNAARASLARAARLVSRDMAYIEQEVERLLPLVDFKQTAATVEASTGALRSLDPSLQGHLLRDMLRRLLGDVADVEQSHIERLAHAIRHLDVPDPSGQLPRGLRVVRRADRFQLTFREPERFVLREADLTVPGNVDVATGRLVASVLPSADVELIGRMISVCGPLHLLADAQALGSPLRVRSRQPGDRMRPLGLGGTRKVKDILIDRRIPRTERDRVLVVENERHIVWLPGIAMDERVSVRSDTRAVAHVRCVPTSA